MSSANNPNYEKSGKKSEKQGGNRERYVKNVKTEMIFFNFGLPSNPKYVNLEWNDVLDRFKALQELWVRLNVYLANGEKQTGTIDYPEANRIIEYNFDNKDHNNCYVRFYSTRNADTFKQKTD